MNIEAEIFSKKSPATRALLSFTHPVSACPTQYRSFMLVVGLVTLTILNHIQLIVGIFFSALLFFKCYLLGHVLPYELSCIRRMLPVGVLCCWKKSGLWSDKDMPGNGLATRGDGCLDVCMYYGW